MQIAGQRIDVDLAGFILKYQPDSDNVSRVPVRNHDSRMSGERSRLNGRRTRRPDGRCHAPLAVPPQEIQSPSQPLALTDARVGTPLSAGLLICFTTPPWCCCGGT